MYHPLEKKIRKTLQEVASEGYLGAQLGQWKSIAEFPSFFFLKGMADLLHDLTPGGPGVAIFLAYFHPKATQHGWTHQEPNYKVPTSNIKAHKSPDHVCSYVALIDILTLPFNCRY